MVYRYNSYTTRKIFYIKILIRQKIVELSRELLSIAYRGKEKKILLIKIKRISIIQKIKKSRDLVDLRELVVKP